MNNLVLNGKLNAYLRLPREEMTPVQAEAVETFSAIFSRITGLTLPRSREICHGVEIAVGGALPEGVSLPDLGEEGYAFTLRRDKVILSGGSLRGLLYGTYAFFERYFGCRWFSDRLTLIPKRGTLSLPTEEDFASVPDFYFRRNCNIESRTQTFSLANGINSPRVNGMLSAAQGGEFRVSDSLAHTIGRRYIPDAMFDEHPEYFPLVNGERIHGPWKQRCLTNPDVLKITIEKAKQVLKDDPQVRYVGISQMDTGAFDDGSCQCENCRAIEEATGAKSGLIIWFVNQVADALKEEYPHVMVETLAYRYTRQPPKNIVPRPNVAICLCSIECCFSHEMDKCNDYNESEMIGGRSGNKLFLEDLAGWGELSKNLIIWDYVTNFRYYMAPQPNIHTFGRNMQIFYDNGVRGYYPEGAHDIYGSEMQDLKAYLLAKLAWDRFYDVEKGTREFVGFACGAGAPFIMDYIHALNERAETLQAHFCCYEDPKKDFFSDEFMAFAEACFDKAEAVAENEFILDNIRRWRLSIRYIRLALYAADFEPAALWDEFASFLSDMKRFGIEGISEHRFYEGSVTWLKETIDRQLAPKAE